MVFDFALLKTPFAYAFGAILSLYILRVLLELYKRFLRPRASLSRFGAGKGAWAVVTGASDGIGKMYCHELAKRGFNVLLISRTLEKLEAVEKSIQERHGDKISTRVLVVDFAKEPIPEWYAKVQREVQHLSGPVGVLVNNVGVSFSFPAKYMDSDHDWNDVMMDINIKAVNEMTHLCLPQMLEKKSGAIINVSSISGQVPLPMLSTYSASKAYVKTFSSCLNAEYSKQGIAVQVVTPHFVATKMAKMRPSLICCTPDVVAKGSLDTLGVESHWNPYLVHAIIEYVMKSLPQGFLQSKVMAENTNTRKRALRKLERKSQSKKAE